MQRLDKLYKEHKCGDGISCNKNTSEKSMVIKWDQPHKKAIPLHGPVRTLHRVSVQPQSSHSYLSLWEGGRSMNMLITRCQAFFMLLTQHAQGMFLIHNIIKACLGDKSILNKR